MCVFCATVPMAASVGAMATAKQKQARREQAEVDTPDATPTGLKAIPAERVTAVVIAGIVAGSVFYHSQISPV